MKKAKRGARHGVLGLVLLVVLAACAPTQARPAQPTPCAEELYLQLGAAPPDSLSEREWVRLHELEQVCADSRVAGRDDGRHGGMHIGEWHWLSMGVVMLLMGAFAWH